MKYIFFDIDGTLHREDIFLEFIKFCISKRLFNLFILFPLIFLSFTLYLLNPKGKIALNCILFLIFLGINKKNIQNSIDEFCYYIPNKITPFNQVLDILENHLSNGDKVILISGTPVEFIKKIYPKFFNKKNITVIASITQKKYYSFYLKERCVHTNKKKMLNRFFNKEINFSYGYSDSLTDLPILNLCDKAYIIDKKGSLKKLHEFSNV